MPSSSGDQFLHPHKKKRSKLIAIHNPRKLIEVHSVENIKGWVSDDDAMAVL